MQRAYLAVAAGVVTMLVFGIAVAEGMVLSVGSVPVAMVAGLLAGAVVGALFMLAIADRDTPPVQQHVATGSLLFGTIALLIFIGASSANVSNTTSLGAGIVVGAVVGGGVLFWLRENANRQVTAL